MRSTDGANFPPKEELENVHGCEDLRAIDQDVAIGGVVVWDNW